MDAVAERYAAQSVGAYFLYVNEAHPGQFCPPHVSMEDKAARAGMLREVYGLRRPVLLDALDGAVHRHFGSMPNMTWIFNRSGRAVYKSDWSDSESAASAIAYYLDVVGRRAGGENLTPFTVQRVDYRNRDREAFFTNLERAGQQAVDDFNNAFGASWATSAGDDHDPPPG